jgi:hypothetical protein
MLPQTAVSLSAIQKFIRHDLRRKLRKDLRKLMIVKEADLECASYFHIRRFVAGDERWRILARKHSKKTGRYIDLLIFKNARPRIAIELKWRRKKITGKDRRSLQTSLKQLQVNKAYFICAIPNRSTYRRLKKLSHEKYLLHECIVGLDWPTARMKLWEQHRRRFTRDMQAGKAKH